MISPPPSYRRAIKPDLSVVFGDEALYAVNICSIRGISYLKYNDNGDIILHKDYSPISYQLDERPGNSYKFIINLIEVTKKN